jgi:hypothetical protein
VIKVVKTIVLDEWIFLVSEKDASSHVLSSKMVMKQGRRRCDLRVHEQRKIHIEKQFASISIQNFRCIVRNRYNLLDQIKSNKGALVWIVIDDQLNVAFAVFDTFSSIWRMFWSWDLAIRELECL